MPVPFAIVRSASAVRLRSLLARHGWLIAIACAYLYVFPYFPRIHSANELPSVYLVKAIVEDHTFSVDREVQRYDWSPDLAAHNGHMYQNKAPGSSLLAVPVYAVVRWIAGEPGLEASMALCRIVTGVVPSLLFLWLLFGFLERFAPDPDIRRLVVITYALGSLAMTYALLFFSHQLSAVCAGSAWILGADFADRRRGLVALAASGFLAGAAVLVDYEAAFAIPPVAIWLIVRMWRWPRVELLRAIAIAAVAAAIPLALLLDYHSRCFGGAFSTGYGHAVTYAKDHDHGLLGMTWPHLDALYGTMIAPDNGLFTLAPWLALAFPGAVMMWRRGQPGVAVMTLVVFAAFLWFVTSIGFWRAGWEVGPRYLTAMLPFLLPLVAAMLAALHDRPLALGAAAGLMIVGVVVYSLSSATFPYWPDPFNHPLFEITFRLVADGLFAPNLGSALGLPAWLAIVPFLAIVGWLVGRGIQRVCGLRGLAVAVGVALVAFAALSLVPHEGPSVDAAYGRIVHSVKR